MRHDPTTKLSFLTAAASVVFFVMPVATDAQMSLPGGLGSAVSGLRGGALPSLGGGALPGIGAASAGNITGLLGYMRQEQI